MQLSKSNLENIRSKGIEKPAEPIFGLPEKVLQFGTGVLLRGLCDFFIDKANRQGIFNGRIVVVKSTSAGDADAFADQDNLYTICVRGMDSGKTVEENIICSAISRVISARSDWEKVLELAESPQLQVIISNTTEVGIQLVKENISGQPPASYPGKLLAFLHRRFIFFKGGKGSGMVVIPTELITGNGDKLRGIVEELAAFNHLDQAFSKWLKEEVHFCNSLVDRIVTKDPGQETLDRLQKELGYEDKLLTMCEDYRLWPIQGNKEVEAILSFTAADEGVFVAPDIEIYKSLKLHLLNGTHTLSASLAYLAGFDTVKQAMADPDFLAFVQQLMLKEISEAIPFQIPEKKREQFGLKVLDRFRNPFLQHQWLNITFQQTTKMRMRNLPVLAHYAQANADAPACMATGFAAYILFMKAVRKEGDQYSGMRNGQYYVINDDHAPFFYELWQRSGDTMHIVTEVLGNIGFWGQDLNKLDKFRALVGEMLQLMMDKGARNVLSAGPK